MCPTRRGGLQLVLAPNFTLTVTHEGDGLYLQATGLVLHQNGKDIPGEKTR